MQGSAILNRNFAYGAVRATIAVPRIQGPAVQLLLLAASGLWVFAGGPLHVLALLQSGAALSLALVLLEGEKRRNAALRATLDRLSREVGVLASGQD